MKSVIFKMWSWLLFERFGHARARSLFFCSDRSALLYWWLMHWWEFESPRRHQAYFFIGCPKRHLPASYSPTWMKMQNVERGAGSVHEGTLSARRVSTLPSVLVVCIGRFPIRLGASPIEETCFSVRLPIFAGVECVSLGFRLDTTSTWWTTKLHCTWTTETWHIGFWPKATWDCVCWNTCNVSCDSLTHVQEPTPFCTSVFEFLACGCCNGGIHIWRLDFFRWDITRCDAQRGEILRKFCWARRSCEIFQEGATFCFVWKQLYSPWRWQQMHKMNFNAGKKSEFRRSISWKLGLHVAYSHWIVTQDWKQNTKIQDVSTLGPLVHRRISTESAPLLERSFGCVEQGVVPTPNLGRPHPLNMCTTKQLCDVHRISRQVPTSKTLGMCLCWYLALSCWSRHNLCAGWTCWLV